MKDTEKAYIAGIIDGEGSITLVKQHKNRNPSPMVSVASTDLELLIWLKKTINGANIYISIKKHPSGCYFSFGGGEGTHDPVFSYRC